AWITPVVGCRLPVVNRIGRGQLTTDNRQLFLDEGCFRRRLGRTHVDVAAEPGAFGDDDLRRLDVAVDARAGHQLDALVSGDVAVDFPLDRHVARVHFGLDACLRSDPQLAGEI